MSGTRRVAICPGSFDPFTVGHEDIVRRALAFVDEVVVGVGHTATQSKRHLLAVPDRVELIRECFADEPRVTAVDFQGLAVEFARAQGATVVVRGLRNAEDFEYESRMARMNRALAGDVDTAYLAADPRHVFLSATLVREVWSLGGDVEQFVPAAVFRRLERMRGKG